MQTEYPFSRLFGRADSRDTCAASSAKIYEKLVKSQYTKNPNLQFSTLAKIATTKTGEVQDKKLKQLINLFRPNKDKELTLLDFTRVCVTVCYHRATSCTLSHFIVSFDILFFQQFSAWILCIESYERFQRGLAMPLPSNASSK
jgi:hypothetical protein